MTTSEDDAFFLLGVGGMGMSAIAHYLLDRGAAVAGADREHQRGRCLALSSRGVPVYAQGAGGLSDFLRATQFSRARVVRSAAVEMDTPDATEALNLGLALEDRSSLVADLFNDARQRVAVVGSAGKTTTSAMLCHILNVCGSDPSYLIGGMIGDRPNGRFGSSGIFVLEADESAGSLDHYRPHLVLFTNLFFEHRPISELREILGAMFAALPGSGKVLHSIGDAELCRAYGTIMRPTAGTLTAVSTAPELCVDHEGDVFTIPIAGHHNYLNAELAVAGAFHLGISVRDALGALTSFPGVENRMSHAGSARGVSVYTDFAHAPEEIAHSYQTAQALGNRVLYVYQPHGFGPTYLHREALCAAFASMRPTDKLFLTDIFYGGGTAVRRITGPEFSRMVASHHRGTVFIEDLKDLPPVLSDAALRGDVVVLAGARTIHDWARPILGALLRGSADAS